MIMDAQNNIEKILKPEYTHLQRFTGAALVLDLIGVDDAVDKLMAKESQYREEHGSFKQIPDDSEDYPILMYRRDKAVIYDVCKDECVLPYALYNNTEMSKYGN